MFLFKVCEKIDPNSGWFLISGWVRFLERFFEVMNEFFIVSKVFWVKKKRVAKQVFKLKEHRP